MRALEERKRKNHNSERKNTDLLIIEPSKLLFKVVVNNYKRQEKSFIKLKEQFVETMMIHHQGLPPQPTGYLKFPEYDWF